MGLDSVELIVACENYFDIRILDEDAEQIVTVQDLVDCVAMYLNISAASSALKDKIFQNLRQHLINSSFPGSTIKLTGLISETIPKEMIACWDLIFQKFGRSVRFPDDPKTSWWSKIFPQVQFDYNTVTYDELVDVICAMNHQQLIDKKSISTKYEIYIILMATIEDRLGVHVFEIKPDKSFVYDFGID